MNLLGSGKLLAGAPVFAAGGLTFYWEDVILAGAAWGSWALLERDLRSGMTLLARAAAENSLPPRAELDAAITSFRYERNLISAQETRDWLARWSLAPGDWFDYLRRQLVQARTIDGRASCDADDDKSLSTPIRELYVDAVCSGTLERLARDLAIRAACLALDRQPPPAQFEGANSNLSSWTDDDVVLQMGCRLGVPPSRGRERLSLLMEVEQSYDCFRARSLDAEALAREVASHALEWTRIACEIVTFEDQTAAREALLCLRADGRTLHEVASAANRPATSECVYLDESSGIAEQLLGARQGDVIGPVAAHGRFVVIEVHERVPASCGDPEIIRRAESSIVNRLAATDLAPVIRWQKAF